MAVLNDYVLTSEAVVKEYLKLGQKTTPDASEDSVIVRAINAASAQFEKRCGWGLLTRTYTGKTYDGNGTADLWLPVMELTAITSVALEDESAVTISTEIDIYQHEALARFNSDASHIWTKGIKNITMTFVAGYASIPADVEDAVVFLAAERYYDRDRQQQNVVSRSVGGETIAYRTSWPKWVLDTITNYTLPNTRDMVS